MSSETTRTEPRPRLGQILLDRNLITPEKLEVALKEQAALGKSHKLGKILINLGFITEKILIETLSYQLGIKSLAFSSDAQVMKIAISDPLDSYILESLRSFSGKSLELYISSEKDIMEAIEQYFSSNVQMTTIMEGMREEELESADMSTI
jgi:hypothetical protein